MKAGVALTVAACVAALAAACAKVTPADEAIAAYKAGQYTRALDLARPSAENGDPKAQNLLGNLYQYGRGVPQDTQEALRWLRKAAEGGYVPAQFNLGTIFSEGQGLTPDPVEGYAWFALAAAHGDQDAARNLLELEREMEPAQVASAKKRAQELLGQRQIRPK